MIVTMLVTFSPEETWLRNGNTRPLLWFTYLNDTVAMFNGKDTTLKFFIIP